MKLRYAFSKRLRAGMLLLLISSVWLACEEKNTLPDTSANTAPVITLLSQSVPVQTTTLCGASFSNVLHLNTGDTLRLTFRFEGVNALAQYKLDVHNNFDCHSHKSRSIPWSVLRIVPLSGNAQTVTETLVIPEDAAAGNYHFMLRLLDVLGNEAEFVEFNVVLTNPEDTEPPVISLTTPSAETLAVEAGNALLLEGLITDNHSLKNGRFELSYTDAAQTTFQVQQFFFHSSPHTSFTLQTSYTIPVYAVKGEAVFLLQAYDEVNNIGQKRLLVHIL